MSSLASRPRSAPGADEARFGVGAWLTLVAATAALGTPLLNTLLGIVQLTMQPAHASLWWYKPEESR